jgi:uncharacterized membrane protein
MEWIKLIGDITCMVLGIWSGYKFFTGDKSKRETLWYGLLMIAMVI